MGLIILLFYVIVGVGVGLIAARRDLDKARANYRHFSEPPLVWLFLGVVGWPFLLAIHGLSNLNKYLEGRL